MDPLKSQSYQFAAILAGAAAAGAVGQLLRQPLIVMFIAVGLAAGPAGLGVVKEGEGVEVLARMGIALLLFLVGLRLDVHMIRTLGPVAVAVGLGQAAATAAGGLGLALAAGLDAVPAGCVAAAVTFSSTIIVVKPLSDKKGIDTLHGRIAVGVLIVQDVVVILVMIGLSAVGAAGPAADPWAAGLALFAKGVGFLTAAGLAMRYALPPLAGWPARSQELLVLFAIAWAMAQAAAGDALGFSKEVGAFVAGVSLASTPFRGSIGGRLVSLRDFLLLFFLLHRAGGRARPVAGRRPARAGGCAVGVRAGRQANDRAGPDGGHGVPQADRVPGRHRPRPGERVLPHPRGPGRDPGPRVGRRHEPDHPGRAGHCVAREATVGRCIYKYNKFH